jgi:hypothetical protein
LIDTIVINANIIFIINSILIMSIITIIIIIGSTIVIIVTILVIVGYPYLKSSIYLVCRCSARLLSQSVALTLRQLQREEYEAHVADLIRYRTRPIHLPASHSLFQLTS